MILKQLELHTFRVIARYLFWQIVDQPFNRINKRFGSVKLVVYYFRGIPSFAIHWRISENLIAYEVYPINGELKAIYHGKYPNHMLHDDNPIK